MLEREATSSILLCQGHRTQRREQSTGEVASYATHEYRVQRLLLQPPINAVKVHSLPFASEAVGTFHQPLVIKNIHSLKFYVYGVCCVRTKSKELITLRPRSRQGVTDL